MNVLEMLLQRIRAPGAPDPAWQAHLDELNEAAVPLPPRDEYIRSPGQGGINTVMHPNALGIYGWEGRTSPAGDDVMSDPEAWWRRRGDVPSPPLPLVDQSEIRKWLNPNPDALPGPEGFTRIAMRGPPGAPQQSMPSAQNPMSMPPADDAAWLDRVLQGGAALRQPALPEGLPDIVRQSILNQPSYSEQSNIPRRINPGDYSDFDVEFNQRDPYERERLKRELDWKSQFPQMDFPVPEGAWANPTLDSPYSSPLNQLLQRGPFALY